MEELDFQELLDQFNQKGFQRGEQVILGNFGTVQTLLSLIFNVPVNVQLIDQKENTGVITRRVKLVAGQATVAYATSHIPRSCNDKDVIQDIIAGTLGLGQIVVKHKIPNSRTLLSVGRDKAGFWRDYKIEGPKLHLEIGEWFPRKVYEKVGWLRANEATLPKEANES